MFLYDLRYKRRIPYLIYSTISLIGRDCSNDLTWLKGKPEIGDKIIIKVIETVLAKQVKVISVSSSFPPFWE